MRRVAVATALLSLVLAAYLPALGSPSFDLVDLSLEELMEVEVSLVSRRPQSLAETAAAVTVVTGEELRRAGVRTLPDALRLVPGFQVAQIDANKWVVTSRGFAGLFSNKLLVLIDGRSVYTPLFAGVFWESQHVLPEDVERIEVIRGPGGTLWGANAVNGIVNVITRDAAAGNELYVTAGGGDERRYVAARRRHNLGENGHLRAYVERFARGRTTSVEARPVRDAWHMSRTGLRADLELSAEDRLSLQADAFGGAVGQSLSYVESMPPPLAQPFYFDADVFGADVLGRWQHGGVDDGLEVQAYYDVFHRQERFLSGTIHNLDIDLQRRHRSGRHRMVAGAGYRLTTDELEGSFTMSFRPARHTNHLLSVFVHDEVSLRADELRLSLGTKLEHNGYSGLEWQPDVRVWWSPRPDHALWAAATRAVRTPSRGDHDIDAVFDALPADSLFAGAPMTLVKVMGDADYDAENVIALDAGYRAVLGDGWVADLAVFRNRYDDLLSQEPGLPVALEEPVPHLVLPLRSGNLAKATTLGFEATLEWSVRPWWQVRGIYSFLDIDLELLPGSRDFITATFPGSSPRHQLGLRSLARAGQWSLVGAGRWVDAIDALGVGAYVSLDARVARTVGDSWELAITGRNLLESRHREATSTTIGAVHTAVQREFFLSLSWRHGT